MKLPATIALIILVAYLLFDLKVLSSHNWDPRVFIMARRPEIPKDQGR